MQDGPRYLTETDLSVLTTTKQTQFGAVGATEDGRMFRYVSFGGTGTVNAGLLVVAPAKPSNSNGLAIPATQPISTSLQAGSTALNFTNGGTAITQDQFAEGFLEVLWTGGAMSYRVRGNTADSTGTGTVTIFLADPLRNAAALVAGTDTVNVTPSPYSAVIASLTASLPAGVTILQVPNTASVTNYGWVQAAGLTYVSATSATKGGDIAQDTSGTAGFVANSGASTSFGIGAAKESATSSKAPVFLTLL